MQPIVCATQGGEVSRRTQEKAIDLARERGAELIFLYVADLSSVGPVVDDSLVEALKDEMARLGRALLRIAQGRAHKQGVMAQAVVVHGPLQQSIKDYLCQVEAGMVVIGTPRTGAMSQAFTLEGIQHFAQSVHQETAVEVVVVT
jgi:nucleotide-binding universal stress UspA family protein